jgi:excisionase family DNA binding protein
MTTAAAPASPDETRWVSLGDASRLLGVNESTLRRWSDAGQVRSYRTPGGHRRFAERDLLALLSGGLRRSSRAFGGLGDVALARIRRDIRRGRNESWYRGASDEDERGRLRDLGRHLLELVPECLARGPKRARAHAEALDIGRQYGHELRRMGLSSRDAVQAFTFFRHSLVEAAKQFAAREGRSAEESEEAGERIIALADEMLLALLEAHEAPEPAASS